MAQHFLYDNAISSYQKDWRTGAITYPSRIKVLTYYKLAVSSSARKMVIEKANVAKIKFPPRKTFDKKRYISCVLSIAPTDKETGISSGLPYGSEWVHAVGNNDEIPNGFWNYVSNWRTYYKDISSLSMINYCDINSVYDPDDCSVTMCVFGGVVGNMYTRNYVVREAVEFDSHTGQYPPKIKYIYEDVIPQATNLYPSKFVNKKVANTFKWKLDYDKTNVTGVLKQSYALFRWRAKGTSNYTEIRINGETPNYTMPSNTIKTTEIEWQVVVVSDDNIASAPSKWITLTTIDSKPSCEATFPVGVFINGSENAVFTWNHIIDTGSPQTKYDIQYTVNGTTWITLGSKSTSIQSHTVPANTLPAGNLQWRVRTYNTDNVVSAWCKIANFMVRSAPPAPNITNIIEKSRPTITWGAKDQEAFKLTVSLDGSVIYDTGVIGTRAMSHKVPFYLDDNSYTFSLTVINNYNLESKPTKGIINIVTEKPLQPNASCELVKDGVKLLISAPPTSTKLYVLRNDKPVVKLAKSSQWVDYGAIGETKYIIRAIDANDNYNDSEAIYINANYGYSTLAPVINISNVVPLEVRRGRTVEHSGTLEASNDIKYFAGREYPVVTFDNHSQESKPIVYTLRKQEDFDNFRRLVALHSTLLFRSSKTGAFYGVITSYEYSYEKLGIDVSCDIHRVDYIETIDYD